MKYLFLTILFLSSCASNGPSTFPIVAHGGQWETVYNDEGMPVASYNQAQGTSYFYQDRADAFVHAMKANRNLKLSIQQCIQQVQTLQAPPPSAKAVPKKEEKKVESKKSDKKKEAVVEKNSDHSGDKGKQDPDGAAPGQ